jgi:GTP-binding protein HflX
MNRLTGAGQLAADMLFATLDTKTVRWPLTEGRSVLLSDTVGFVRDIPHGLVASFRATLEETVHADLLLHVVDASSPMALQQMESVDAVLKEIGCADAKRIVLLNKIDVARDTGPTEILALRGQSAMQISAKTGAGVDELAAAVAEHAHGDLTDATVLVPQRDGKLLAEFERDGEIQHRAYVDAHVRLSLRINRGKLTQVLGRHKQVTLISNSREEALEPLDPIEPENNA